MKKSTIIAIVAVVLVVAILAAGLCIWLCFGQLAESKEQNEDLLSYTRSLYPQYTVSVSDSSLILSKNTSMTYVQACAFGGEIYCDELAPETYLSQVKTILTDLQQHYDQVTEVMLCYMSTDAKAVFTVSSTGQIWTCWSAE